MKSFIIFQTRGMFAIFCVLLFMVRPVYSIPAPIEELCAKFNLDVCAGDKKKDGTKKDDKPKVRSFSENERKTLTTLIQKEKMLENRQQELDRREVHLKGLQEDIQRQIIQLEELQKKVENRIDEKKTQDSQQLDKAVSFYEKMDGKKAAESISKLNPKIAVQLLMKLKDKTASEILSNMNAEDSARLVEAITKK